MTEPTTYAAHIITADAVALGDPELIIMTRDEGMGAEIVERHELGTAESLTDTLITDHGWRPVGDPTHVQTGYYVVDVERV